MIYPRHNDYDSFIFMDAVNVGFVNSTATIAEETSGLLCVSILDVEQSDVYPTLEIPLVVSVLNLSSGLLNFCPQKTVNKHTDNSIELVNNYY